MKARCKVNDYYTTKIGRQSVFITRNKDNQLNCFINASANGSHS